jgi:hypothetical protein
MRMWKKVLLWLAVVFVTLQFFRPEKNLSQKPAGKDDFLVHFDAPPAVRQIFSVACYDCHSNNTRYPWYAHVQPVAWWLQSHIEEAKDTLNLSEFAGYSAKRQGRKIDAINDEISDHTMPLKSYTWIHRDARLTEAQVKQITDWLDTIREKLPPAD